MIAVLPRVRTCVEAVTCPLEARWARDESDVMSSEALTGHNLAFVEALYADYLEDPTAVSADWRAYFAGLEPGLSAEDLDTPAYRKPVHGAGGRARLDIAARQDRVDQLVRAYRVRGHMIADLDPLGLQRELHPELNPKHYGFTEADLDQRFSARTLEREKAVLTLREIIAHLRRTYSRSLGVQFMHIDNLKVKSWLQHRMETTENSLAMTRDQQLRVLTKLTDAEIFEQFIHKKFLGAKRFSLEGGESLIPLVDAAIQEAGEQGIDEVVIAMAHRGRLNVLANIMNKDPAHIFREFADKDPDLYFGGGDVKYHMGFSSDVTTPSGKTLHLSLCFNPSHLEFVNPVLVGRVRSKQDRRGDYSRERVMPILIHGDSAFAGQGIVQETLNMSELPGYWVGGTVHVIVNNQIGFTTTSSEGRSSYYATDIAKVLEIPIIHVNGENPEAAMQAIKLAMDFRREFRKDVIIDLWCYRRYGHNEGDDPAFTQPLLYQTIRKRKTVREGYLENLLKLGGVTQTEADEIAVRRRQRLDEALSLARGNIRATRPSFGKGAWRGYLGGLDISVPDVVTALPVEHLRELLTAASQVPEGFTAHSKIVRFLGNRVAMARGERKIDWGGGEALAFASLLDEGHRVRLSGQDSGRGTFSHRHSVLHDQTNGNVVVPLNLMNTQQARIEPLDSPLSEGGVLGFEYGYSLDQPETLVIWEAQFGDFVNSAQVIIDQFIVSSEDKWHRLSGLVMLLPHGFEGQGPEHSSGRLERFLQMCAEDNIYVCNLTTPAQLFHCLRRQVIRKLRKPLIIMTPKSLLRHPEAVSTLEDFSERGFQRIIPDDYCKPEAVDRVLLCTGKLYYELTSARAILEAGNVAIVRIEQLYPLRTTDLEDALGQYADGTRVVWVQEEPHNMGAWRFLRIHLGDTLLGRMPFSGLTRPESASPATGSSASHRMEQELLIEQAFELS